MLWTWGTDNPNSGYNRKQVLRKITLVAPLIHFSSDLYDHWVFPFCSAAVLSGLCMSIWMCNACVTAHQDIVELQLEGLYVSKLFLASQLVHQKWKCQKITGTGDSDYCLNSLTEKKRNYKSSVEIHFYWRTILNADFVLLKKEKGIKWCYVFLFHYFFLLKKSFLYVWPCK